MWSENSKIGLIVLAAGNSLRMNGASKQLLEFRGKSLLRRVAETAVVSNFRPVKIILGNQSQNLNSEIADLPVEAVFNSETTVGMSYSIKTGINAVSALKLDALIFTLCDQPMISVENLQKLVDLFEKTRSLIVASAYENTIGVPALFSRAVFPDLLNLRGDQGAKKVIEKYMDETVLISMPEAAFDVDTPLDYKKLIDLA